MKHVFKRKEEKFILPLSVADNIQLIVQQGLDFSEFNRGGSLTDIRTTYLENNDYLIYHMKKTRQDKRYKVRFREYGKNGKYESSIWVELKEKANGQGYKSRFKIDRKHIIDFIEGKKVFHHVIKKNKSIDNDYLALLYDRIQSLILENELYPRLSMQYQRLALQAQGDQGVRLTFDYNLHGGIINTVDELFQSIENPEYFDRYKSIVELKIGNSYPKAANVIKREFNIEKQKFSKFVFGMESCVKDFYKMPLVIESSYIPMSEIVQLDREYAI